MTSGGVLFINPSFRRGQRAPVASWISAAGWARAARRLWGQAWVVTPEGVFEPEEMLTLASRPQPRGSAAERSLRRLAPTTVKTGLKDLRKLVEARRFREVGLEGPWRDEPLRFVWQRHDLFHDAGAVAARAMDRPLVAFVPALLVGEAREWGVRRPGWGRLLERVAEARPLSRADLVACGSEEVAEQALRIGIAERQILVTPNGVDPEIFTPDADGAEVRRRLGLEGRFVVGWVGSFRGFHGLEMGLEAMGKVCGEDPSAALLLIGDGLERPRIEAAAQRLGPGNVVFTGAVEHALIPEHIAAMDVALITDRGGQGFHYSPLKLREYMAAGRPVVAPASGEMGRWLRDGVDALLVEPGDAAGLAEAVSRLRGDPGLRRRLGAAARDKVLAEATWDIQLKRIDEALHGLSSPDPEPAR